MTAWHALKNVARIRAGESILIHAGAGGVGMAAIQIAHHLKVEVIATAGSAMKRALGNAGRQACDRLASCRLRRDDHGTDRRPRRRCHFEFARRRSDSDGTFLLGGIWSFHRDRQARHLPEYPYPLWPMRRNASFHVVAMDAVFSGDEQLASELLAKLPNSSKSAPYHRRPSVLSRRAASMRLFG